MRESVVVYMITSDARGDEVKRPHLQRWRRFRRLAGERSSERARERAARLTRFCLLLLALRARRRARSPACTRRRHATGGAWPERAWARLTRRCSPSVL